MEPEVLIAGRNMTLTCNGVKGTKAPKTACGIDQDIFVSCPVTSPHVTPYVRVIKRNLDTDDTGIWECVGNGASPLTESIIITVGEYDLKIFKAINTCRLCIHPHNESSKELPCPSNFTILEV